MADAWGNDPIVDFTPEIQKKYAPVQATKDAPQATSWLDWMSREAGIFGSNLAEPTMSLIGSTGMKPPAGPTPQGPGERILAATGQGMGYALPATALAAGLASGADLALAPALMARFAPGILAGTGAGAAAGQARREFLPNAPGGQAIDAGLGLLAGGMAGGGTAMPTLGRVALASGLGAGFDFLGRMAGIPAGVSRIADPIIDMLVLRGLRGGRPSTPAIAGAEAGMLTGPAPQ